MNQENSKISTEQKSEESKQRLEVRRIYAKRSVFDLIGGVETFLLKEQPKLEFEIKNTNSKLKEDNHHEVTLGIKLKLTIADKEICKAEIDQAGIFMLSGFNKEQEQTILNGHCADVLYPYLCNKVAMLTNDASFPAIQLQPLNFSNLYQQKLAQEAVKEK